MRFDVENFISPSEFGSFCLGNFLINFASSPGNMKEAGKLYKTYRAHEWSPLGSVLALYQESDTPPVFQELHEHLNLCLEMRPY